MHTGTKDSVWIPGQEGSLLAFHAATAISMAPCRRRGTAGLLLLASVLLLVAPKAPAFMFTLDREECFIESLSEYEYVELIPEHEYVSSMCGRGFHTEGFREEATTSCALC